MVRNPILAVLAIFFSCAVAFPQSNEDTTFVNAAVHNTIQLYYTALKAQSRLNNGSKYRAPEHSIEQHPYLASEDWLTGSVFYDGELFTEVPLMFDLYNRVLITEHYPSGNSIQLVTQKLHHFTLGGHYFERIQNEAVANSLPGTDFYDILYQGKTRVVAYRKKLLKKEIESNVIEISYDEKNRYFMLKDGVYLPVKSKASVLKILSDEKRELKRFCMQNRSAYWHNRELMLKDLAEHYDTLK